MEERKENATYGLNEPYQNNVSYEQQSYDQNAQNANMPYGQNPAYDQNMQNANMPYGQNPAYDQNAQYGQQPYMQQQYNQPQYNYPVRAVVRNTMSERNNAGIAGLVISCFAILGCWIPAYNLVFSIAGIICSAIGLGKNRQTGRGLAVAGLIISIIALVISLIMCALLIIGLSL